MSPSCYLRASDSQFLSDLAVSVAAYDILSPREGFEVFLHGQQDDIALSPVSSKGTIEIDTTTMFRMMVISATFLLFNILLKFIYTILQTFY